MMTTKGGAATVTGGPRKHNAYPNTDHGLSKDLAPFTKDPPPVRPVTAHEFTGNGGPLKVRKHNAYNQLPSAGDSKNDLAPYLKDPPPLKTAQSEPVVKRLGSGAPPALQKQMPAK